MNPISPAESDTAKLQKRNRELSILNSIAQALNRSIDLDQALQAALAEAAELLDLHTGWIWLLDESTGDSYLAASQNLPPALAENPRRMEGSCYCLDTYRAGDLDGAANINVLTCSRLWGLVGGTEGLRYHASIPLYAQGRQLGVLNLASTDWRELTSDDLRLLYTLGDLLSIAVERARLYAHRAEFGAAEERNRLAREIHDTLAQGLAGIALQLETADALLESGADLGRARPAVRQAMALTRASLEEARRSVLDLRAAPLEGRSLIQALSDLAEDWNAAHPASLLSLDTGAGRRPLPVRIETGLYRIAQEALNNIARHAQAGRVNVQIITSAEQAALVIQDDGLGFDPTQVPPGRFGLVGLSERAKLLGGALELQSEPGQGTRLEVRIPLE
jgi:two-component system NarL family sensor kinase